MKHISKLILIPMMTGIACADTQLGSLDSNDQTWDRPSSTNASIIELCDSTASDSVNDSVGYDIFYIRAESHSTFMNVNVLSLEPTPIDFDPMLVVYCGQLDPTQPRLNLNNIDDDSNGYPNPSIIGTSFLDPDQVYSVVVSSYSNYAQSQYGNYEINLGDGLYFSTACLPDFSGDGSLNFFDVSIFMTLFNASDPQADLNHDGNVNFFDISEFLSLFTNGCP